MPKTMRRKPTRRLKNGRNPLEYINHHAEATSLGLPIDGVVSTVVNTRTGKIAAYGGGHTFTRESLQLLDRPIHLYTPESPRYGDIRIYASSPEAAKQLRDARYTVKFRLMRHTTTFERV